MPEIIEHNGEKFEVEFDDECRIEVSYKGLKGTVGLNPDVKTSGWPYRYGIEGEPRPFDSPDPTTALNCLLTDLKLTQIRRASMGGVDEEAACQALIEHTRSLIKD